MRHKIILLPTFYLLFVQGLCAQLTWINMKPDQDSEFNHRIQLVDTLRGDTVLRKFRQGWVNLYPPPLEQQGHSIRHYYVGAIKEDLKDSLRMFVEHETQYVFDENNYYTEDHVFWKRDYLMVPRDQIMNVELSRPLSTTAFTLSWISAGVALLSPLLVVDSRKSAKTNARRFGQTLLISGGVFVSCITLNILLPDRRTYRLPD